MGFSRQEYRRGLPFPSPGDLPDPGIEPRSLHCSQKLYPLSHWGGPGVEAVLLYLVPGCAWLVLKAPDSLLPLCLSPHPLPPGSSQERLPGLPAAPLTPQEPVFHRTLRLILL